MFSYLAGRWPVFLVLPCSARYAVWRNLLFFQLESYKTMVNINLGLGDTFNLAKMVQPRAKECLLVPIQEKKILWGF